MLPDVGIPAVGIFRPSRGSERLDCYRQSYRNAGALRRKLLPVK